MRGPARPIFIAIAMVTVGCSLFTESVPLDIEELDCDGIVGRVIDLSRDKDAVGPDSSEILNLTDIRTISSDARTLTCEGHADFEDSSGMNIEFSAYEDSSGDTFIAYEGKPVCGDLVDDIIDITRTEIERGISTSEILKIRDIVEISNVNDTLICQGLAMFDFGEDEQIEFSRFVDEDGDAFVTYSAK